MFINYSLLNNVCMTESTSGVKSSIFVFEEEEFDLIATLVYVVIIAALAFVKLLCHQVNIWTS